MRTTAHNEHESYAFPDALEDGSWTKKLWNVSSPKLMSCAKAREYLDTAISDSKIALSRAFRRTVLVCIN